MSHDDAREILGRIRRSGIGKKSKTRIWGMTMSDGRKPVKYCIKCAVEAVIDDTGADPPPCTNCHGKQFAIAEDYDRIFLASLRIKPT